MTRDGRFVVKRRTEGRRLTRKLHELRAELRRRMHAPVAMQQARLVSVLEDGDPLLLSLREFTAEGCKNLTHLTAAEYVGLDVVSAECFESYFKFAFVRNPWDRVVSEYRYRQHYIRYDFATWVLEHWPGPEARDEYLHVIPQYAFVYDRAGRCLVDFVGKYESLQKDFAEVCVRLGIQGSSLPKRNVSSDPWWHRRSIVRMLRSPREELRRLATLRSDYVDYYDAHTRDVIARRFRNDIDAFGYRFGD